ncbi:hypothetical protein [Segatella hominis]|uniref:hypothetical protein n=1 Tax=Segatella hominis TaxID=2518605 RepID=UPI0021C750A9|nr:hypothetical protein [Segatella hominis]
MALFLVICVGVFAQVHNFNLYNSSHRKVLALYVPDKDGIYQKSDVQEVKEISEAGVYYAYDKKAKKLYVKTTTGNYEVSLDDYYAKDFKKNKAIPQLKEAEIVVLVDRVNHELSEHFSLVNTERRKKMEAARIKAYNDSVAKAKEEARLLAERMEKLKQERESYIKQHNWRSVPTGYHSLYCTLCENTFTQDSIWSVGVRNDTIYFATHKDGDLDLGYLECHAAKVPDELKAYSPYQYHYEVFKDSIENKVEGLDNDLAGFLDYNYFQEYLSKLQGKAPYGYFDGWSWNDEYGTVTFKCTYQNTNKWTIKYIDVYWVVTNDVNDVRGSGHFKGTGPVKYLHGASWDWDSSYYFVGGDATNMSIRKVIITYMNGRQKVLTKNMIKFNSTDDD